MNIFLPKFEIYSIFSWLNPKRMLAEKVISLPI